MFIRTFGEGFCAHGFDRALAIEMRVYLTKVPVLAEEAVERATGVEDREIVIAVAGVSRADPVCDAIRGEWITIPMQNAALGCAGKVKKPPFLVVSKAAKATPAF